MDLAREQTLRYYTVYMGLFIWILIFFVALLVMIVGANVFLKSAEQLGLRLGLSSFVIGVIIVGFGTSLPELASALLAVLENAPSMVVANAMGSNIANILLIGGTLAFLGKKLTIEKDLLSTELPFFVISTALFAVIVFDRNITLLESILLVSTLAVYFYYLFSDKYSSGLVVEAVTEQVQHQRFHFFKQPLLQPSVLLTIGLIGLLFGAQYVVESVVAIATTLSVPPGLLSITAIALGTSLPELVVSIKSLRTNNLSLAIGNIFGSNAFNILVAVGIPGLFTVLPIDNPTYSVGLPMFLLSSVILIIIGFARKLFRWEGIVFFLLYIFFIIELFTFTT